MELTIGPVPSRHAVAFLSYARKVLDELSDEGDLAATLTDDLTGRLDDVLDQWDRVSHADEVFYWVDEVDVDDLRYVAHGLFRVVTFVSEAGGPPVEGRTDRQPFYRAVVEGVLSALEADGSENKEFARQLRDFWPGLD